MPRGGGGGDVNLDAPYSTGIHRHAAFGGGGWGGGGGMPSRLRMPVGTSGCTYMFAF